MLSIISSAFPSLVINAPVVQPAGLAVQQMRQVQSPIFAQPLTGSAIFPTSLQADLLDDEAAAFAAKNAKLRAAKDAMKAKQAEVDQKAEEALAASEAKTQARKVAAEQAAFLKKEQAAAAKQAAQEKAEAKAAAAASSSSSSKSSTSSASTSKQPKQQQEVVKVDSRAERIAKREAEGGGVPSLFGN